MTRLLLPAALAVLLLSGCTGLTGLPAGSADFGDTVTVRYSVTDADGATLRTERTATFVLGSGNSGLGLGFERGLRGSLAGDNLSFAIDDDPSLDFSRTVEVDRHLDSDPDMAGVQGILQDQQAPRLDFERAGYVAAIGTTFQAYGIYTGQVTGVTQTTVNFTIIADEGQQDPVPSVGAVMVSDPDGHEIQRRLDPTVGATFVVNPPTAQNPNTPLGLDPGTYRTLGATEDKIQYGYSTSGALDLLGKDLRFKATILRVMPSSVEDGPVDGNYAARRSPLVNGDPESVLEAAPAAEQHDDGHTH